MSILTCSEKMMELWKFRNSFEEPFLIRNIWATDKNRFSESLRQAESEEVFGGTEFDRVWQKSGFEP